MTRELVLICWKCRLEIGQDDGYLWAHSGEVSTAHRTVQRHDGGSSLMLEELLAYDPVGHFQRGHRRQTSRYRDDGTPVSSSSTDAAAGS
ncbi:MULTISPECIES: hypothetical protein [unclassified Streptomyces]|uniref:hypothetical protein n=1 Tax=Streptomyces sp. NPDC127532 TaxID=3345399 RepID=UPI003628B628